MLRDGLGEYPTGGRPPPPAVEVVAGDPGIDTRQAQLHPRDPIMQNRIQFRAWLGIEPDERLRGVGGNEFSAGTSRARLHVGCPRMVGGRDVNPQPSALTV